MAKARDKLHILLAEDELYIGYLYERLLDECGCTTTVAKNGENAVAVYKDKEGDFDLILMDMRMPVIGGCDASRIIRAYEREQGRESVPIIALTAAIPEDTPEMRRYCEVNAIMAKPIVNKALCEIVRQNVRG